MSAPSFESLISRVLSSWSAYQYALNQSLGGADTALKADWLAASLYDFFTQNKDLEPSEVSDWLSEVVFNEFDLIVEDGSLEVCAEQLCKAYECLSSKNEARLQTFLKSLPNEDSVKRSVQLSKVEKEQEASDSDSEEVTSPQVAQFKSEPMEVVEEQEEAKEKAETSNFSANSESLEDGWTVVSRRKKR